MKKLSRVLFLVAAVSLFTALKSNAQIFVRIRPRAVVVANVPPQPSPRHVWVADGWQIRGGVYVARPGYWALPPHPGAVWIRGHWRDTPRGSVWIEGHWA